MSEPSRVQGTMWDEGYRRGWVPWDIGRPQAAFRRLADSGELTSPLLDCGCGTGEHALMAAERGLDVIGIDIAPTAIEAARSKAQARRLSVQFQVADALSLGELGRTFATVIDSGLFHTFSDEDRPRYVRSLASVVVPGGHIHLMCFSELTPGSFGPRRVTQEKIRQSFAEGWTVESITAERFEVRDDFPGPLPHAWLAAIVRTQD